MFTNVRARLATWSAAIGAGHWRFFLSKDRGSGEEKPEPLQRSGEPEKTRHFPPLTI